MAVWTRGIDNYRVQYQAGYSQIPNDVQEACAEWTAALFWQSKGNPVAVPADAAGAFGADPRPLPAECDDSNLTTTREVLCATLKRWRTGVQRSLRCHVLG